MLAQRRDSSDNGARIVPSNCQIIDRSKTISFDYEGRTIRAFEGDTVASALYASGERIFSRSFKYHRPRGLLCVSGRCPNCLMEIDGVPNVRACTESVRQGIKVRHQNAWPSLNRDFYSLIDKLLDRFMPVGFYYKTFIHEPIPWRRVEGPIRGIAGIGSIEEEIRRTSHQGSGSLTSRAANKEEASAFEHLYLETEIAVVGGGIAGMTAALEACRLGAEVTLIDDQESFGGHLLFNDDVLKIKDAPDEEEAPLAINSIQLVRGVVEDLSKLKRLKVLNGATAFGFYESNLLGIIQGRKMIKLRANQVIVATGAHEYPIVFQNNDLPGIFLGRGLQRLVNLYGINPGRNIVIITNNDSGLCVARSLLEARIQIAAYVDARRSIINDEAIAAELKKLESSQVQILVGYTIKAASGSKKVESATLVQLDEEGSPIEGTEKSIPCDIICLSTGFETESSLLNQAGCKTTFDEMLDEFTPSELKPAIYVCGDVTGIHDVSTNMVQAKVAALRAALNLENFSDGKKIRSYASSNAQELLEKNAVKLQELESDYREKIIRTKSKPITAVSGYKEIKDMKRRFVCICEDVAEKDLSQAVFEGFDNVETLKRYSTVSMGPCQGKMCSMSSVSVCARETGKTIANIGRTVSRPPYQPIPMGALAGAELHPTKLTAMHYKHVELGAELMDMGEWKRPYIYSTVLEEYEAVRERVGLIDVGTLGRLDVKGRDAPKLLDFVYTHIFSKLQIGKIRYGVMCDEGGIILDDGTVTRFSDSEYFMTTTTGNIDFVEQWLAWWASALKLDVQVTNLTSGLAAVNVAGPKARDLLKKLTEIDLSTQSFPYLAAKEGKVAGVPCILLRIGFVGETGWEIHFPAEYGEYFWDALIAAGKEFDVKPFGVETQRLLRLEKKHIIVGQDTDAITNPIEADMKWAIKFEKNDFVGRTFLARSDKTGVKRKLVGFVATDSSVAVREGDQIYFDERISGGRKEPVGFVTSSRMSPALGRSVGMAWIPVESAKEGSAIKIMVDGKLSEAKVTFPAFYDPEGKRLRS